MHKRYELLKELIPLVLAIPCYMVNHFFEWMIPALWFLAFVQAAELVN